MKKISKEEQRLERRSEDKLLKRFNDEMGTCITNDYKESARSIE